MSKPSNGFFAGTTPPLRLGCLGFLIAAMGAALGFAVDYGPGNPLAYVAFTVVATGVAIGFIAIAWGWIDVLRSALGRAQIPGRSAQPTPSPKDPKVPLSGPGGL
ncbi:hypothetical protein [Roseateles noduli]|uniref:hypothetical protein n=1 Tax=Roseateles noduli TaxID=2052484 RepID=UPI003D6460E2